MASCCCDRLIQPKSGTGVGSAPNNEHGGAGPLHTLDVLGHGRTVTEGQVEDDDHVDPLLVGVLSARKASRRSNVPAQPAFMLAMPSRKVASVMTANGPAPGVPIAEQPAASTDQTPT